MNATLFIALMAVLGVANLWIGHRAAKATKTEDDFYLGGRGLGLFPLILTILATQLGGGTMLGAAEEAYHRGWIVMLYPLGTSIGLFAIAMGFGARLRKMNLCTISELFEKVYGSRPLRQFSSLISIVSLFIILVAQSVAARKFFGSLGFEGEWPYLCFWGILITYTVLGGLRAVVNTDILQATFIIGAFAIAFAVADMTLPEPAALVPFDSAGVPWVGWLFMPLLFMFIEQDMGQRFFAAKTPQMVTIGAAVAGGVMFLCTSVPIYFGVQAASLGIEIPEGNSVFLSAINATTSGTVTTIVTVAILMAIISTADTLLCSISSNVSYDFPFLRSRDVKWAQGITLGIGMLSLGASYLVSNVVPVLIFSYELSVSAIFVPVLFAVLAKNPRKEQAFGAVIAGTLSFFVFRFYPLGIPREVVTIALSFAGYYLPLLMTRSRSVAVA
jgi:SSS family solute:Na+ symporter